MYSVFEIFKIGIGPSSSHTVGPMRAARAFVVDLEAQGMLERVCSVRAELFGSLALTGQGHGTDRAVLLGLMGEDPETIDPDSIPHRLANLAATHRLALLGRHAVDFDPARDLVFHRDAALPRHSNGMRFTAHGANGETLRSEDYYSVGGGFVLRSDEPDDGGGGQLAQAPYDFSSAAELLALARRDGISIAELVWRNECSARSADEVRSGIDRIWGAMRECVAHGLRARGELPGGLHVRRRAPELYGRLTQEHGAGPWSLMDWLNLYALSVNEENAAGGRVVTAPTNGAAGIVPAVLHYYRDHYPGASDEGVRAFFFTATAIAVLYKLKASISGAEMGCQGEVGVACSMAAAGLAAALGGSNERIEQAAEIGMEHNLGLTCDPVGGLVQIPCIERNALASVKAVNAARLALCGDGTHRVSLDAVIATMRQTGLDMKRQYKETSLGGLAVNVVEC
jgi:L-serine dehydratase